MSLPATDAPSQWLNSWFEPAIQQLIARYRMARTHLGDACAYALEGGGKRVRPMLTLACAEACGQSPAAAMPFALAIEMVHTYSLIHDDLPMFDDDDWRRGRPSVHRQFDVATAVLAGDALLSDAWAVLTEHLQGRELADPTLLVSWTYALAKACGSTGMVLGQDLDAQLVGNCPSQDHLDFVYQRKTGDLLQVACWAGGRSATPNPATLAACNALGAHLGLLYQYVDDLVDAAKLRRGASDARNNKLTALRVLGETTLRQRLEEQRQRAEEAAQKLVAPARLVEIIGLLSSRKV